MRFPVPARVAVGAIGAVTLAIAIVLLVSPGVVIALWPWKLTPLTGRVMAAMFALPDVVGLGLAMDSRRSAARVILQSQCYSIVLILVAVYLARQEIDWTNVGAWLFTGGLAGMVVMIVALCLLMERSTRRAGLFTRTAASAS
jgi:hypothetical protein